MTSRLSVAEEEAIIRKRFLTQTVATSAALVPPFKKLVTKQVNLAQSLTCVCHSSIDNHANIKVLPIVIYCRYTEFCRAVEGGGHEDGARLHEELLADLFAVQTHMRRLEAAASAFKREQELYHVKQDQLHAAIAQAEQDIIDRKMQLEEARAELSRQQEYEAVKERVVKVPARSATRLEMEAVEKEIADLSQQGAALDASMSLRKAQFASILHVIEQVYQGLEQEGPEEGVVEEEVPEAMVEG